MLLTILLTAKQGHVLFAANRADDFNVEKTHYFDKNYLDKDYPGDRCGHNWKGESLYIQRLIDQGKLKLLKGV